MEEQKIIISQLVDRLAELREMRSEIDAEVEGIILQMKCTIAVEDVKIDINT